MHAAQRDPLFACPGCARPFDPEQACSTCGTRIARSDSIYDFLQNVERSGSALAVEDFYSVRPFPGYGRGDDAPALLDRCRASPFLTALDRAIAPNAVVLDCGTGTGQVAAFLALSAPRRTVVAVDACRASLVCAARFREHAHIENLRLVRADLFALPVLAARFDVVVSRGVVHHTPDPMRAIGEVVRRVAPGGHVVLGFYERFARGLHCARRALSRARGRPIALFDPVLRRADLDVDKKHNWIADQYDHPLEHLLDFPRVLAELERLDFTWVRGIPPALERGELFDATLRPSSAGLLVRRLGWFLGGLADEDAGLVALVARRQERAYTRSSTTSMSSALRS